MSFPKKIKFINDDCICEFKNEVMEQRRIKNGYADMPTGSAVYKYLNGYYFKDKRDYIFGQAN